MQNYFQIIEMSDFQQSAVLQIMVIAVIAAAAAAAATAWIIVIALLKEESLGVASYSCS